MSNSVCNRIHVINKSDFRCAVVRLFHHLYDYRLHSVLLQVHMIIVNSRKLLCCCSWWETGFLQVMSSFIWRMSLKTNIFIEHEDHWQDVRPGLTGSLCNKPISLRWRTLHDVTLLNSHRTKIDRENRADSLKALPFIKTLLMQN